jgi:hypothetical protein
LEDAQAAIQDEGAKQREADEENPRFKIQNSRKLQTPKPQKKDEL